MSKLTIAAATSHALASTAMEEASRVGEHTVGVDHLFLALVVNEQQAGQALRGLGISLEAAREAVADQHASQLASLGIHASTPGHSRIAVRQNVDYVWGRAALEVMKRSAAGSSRGDADAVLRELLAEPSGLIDAILQRLGTTPDVVRDRLDDAERDASRQQHTFDAPASRAPRRASSPRRRRRSGRCSPTRPAWPSGTRAPGASRMLPPGSREAPPGWPMRRPNSPTGHPTA